MLTRSKFIAAIASGTAGAALAAMASGCSILGIEDPNAQQDNSTDVLPAGAVNFENLIVQLNLDTSSWTWTQINNVQSQNNGALVVGIPVTITNNDEDSRVLSPLYCKLFDPSGAQQADITAYFDDDILAKGRVEVGSSESGTVHLLYRGPGSYTLGFDDLLGSKVDLKVDVPESRSTGMRAIPSQLGSLDVNQAIPAGQSFELDGMSLTFDANRDAYLWVQASAPGDPSWDGVWCVGVPLSVVNNSSQTAAVTADLYGKFNGYLQPQNDPAPLFADDITALGFVQPGSSANGYMYFVYQDDGTYYAVFDNQGAKVVTSAIIAQYY